MFKLLCTSILMFSVVAVYAGPKEVEHRTDQLIESGEMLETDAPTRGTAKGAGIEFTDSDDNDWVTCSGKCTMKKRKSSRSDGDHIIIDVGRAKKNGCDEDCSCVLFKSVDGWLVKKLEVDGDSDYLDIHPDTGKGYQVRCCEKD